jgi:rod shape-determining protein MreB
MLDRFLGLFSRDIGIDLGTANTLVHVRDRGIVISEPSVVAIDTRTKQVLAIGAEAKRMVGRTPASIVAVRPLRDGVISDFDVTEQMIRYFVKKVHDRVGLIPRPRMLLGIPSGVTEVEKRAVRDAALNAGARSARLIEEPMAAAIGAGLPVSEPSGSLIVDIGGGTTEVAVISLGGIVVSRSIRVGGDEMDQDIVAFARREYNLFLGERTAEDIKIAIGSAFPGAWDTQRVQLRGRDLLTGLPRGVEVGADQIRSCRSSTRSRTRSRRRRRSWWPTSWTRASCWPAAERCWRVSTSAWPRRPRCPSTSPTTRSPVWREGRARCSRPSRSRR